MKSLQMNFPLMTSLAASATLSILISAPAQAATFLFSYQLSSGATFGGTLEGDLQADNNKVSNITQINAIYSATGEDFSFTFSPPFGDRASLNGSDVFISYDLGNAAHSYIEINSPSGFIDLSSNGIGVTETYVQSRWTMSLQASQDPPSIPEPSLLGGLAFFGLMLQSLKKAK